MRDHTGSLDLCRFWMGSGSGQSHLEGHRERRWWIFWWFFLFWKRDTICIIEEYLVQHNSRRVRHETKFNSV